MSIVGKIRRDKTKLVGVQVPLQSHNFLTLYSLAKGISKAHLLQTLIDDWEKDFEGEESNLIKELSNRINEEWKVRIKEHPKASFNEFKNLLEKELFWKGLTAKQIDIILKQIKQ